MGTVLPTMMTIDQLNQVDQSKFVGQLGGVYEHSPWVAQAAWSQRPFENLTGLINCMRAIVDNVDAEAKLKLLRAHPDLAGKLAVEKKLTSQSQSEQAGLGLDQLSSEDFAKLSHLNQSYREKFGIPFIVCARLLKGIPELLTIFEKRIRLNQSDEQATALKQVHAIAELRLRDLIKENSA